MSERPSFDHLDGYSRWLLDTYLDQSRSSTSPSYLPPSASAIPSSQPPSTSARHSSPSPSASATSQPPSKLSQAIEDIEVEETDIAKEIVSKQQILKPANLGIIPLSEDERASLTQQRENVHIPEQQGVQSFSRQSPSGERHGEPAPEPANLGIIPSAPTMDNSEEPPPYEDHHLYETIPQ